MSNFNQLKSMWQSKSKVQTAVPPPKPLPQKLKPPASKQIVSTPVQQPEATKKIQKQPATVNNQPTVEKQNPKVSVSDLKKNLETILKLGQNNLRATQYQNPSYKVQQPKVEPVQPKKDPREIIPLKGAQKMPTFQQSKMNLQKMFEKKKNEKEGYVTGPSVQSQQFVDLKKDQNDQEKLSPQERAQLVMKRVFTTPETSNSTQFQKQSEGMVKSQTFLQKQEQVKSLNLRGQKKQKKSLGDFDDA